LWVAAKMALIEIPGPLRRVRAAWRRDRGSGRAPAAAIGRCFLATTSET
jgi:hypothetical protein